MCIINRIAITIILGGAPNEFVFKQCHQIFIYLISYIRFGTIIFIFFLLLFSVTTQICNDWYCIWYRDNIFLHDSFDFKPYIPVTIPISVWRSFEQFVGTSSIAVASETFDSSCDRAVEFKPGKFYGRSFGIVIQIVKYTPLLAYAARCKTSIFINNCRQYSVVNKWLWW